MLENPHSKELRVASGQPPENWSLQPCQFSSVTQFAVLLCSILSILWHSLSLGLEWKLTFSNPVATAEFSKFTGILGASCFRTFTASSFRIWNSSTGIASHPLVFFLVMLPKAHLTLHSRMSGSTWLNTPSWLSGSWRSFCTVLCILPPVLNIFCFC